VTPRPARVITGYLVLLSIIWAVAQWDLAGIFAGLARLLPMLLLGAIVVPCGVMLFLLVVLSIPRSGGR
jgi:hypothetical protein